MTAQTSDFSGLLYYNPSTNGFNPIVEATMTGPTSIDEGATATFNVVAWGIPDGPVYWWVTNLFNVTTDRISPGLAAEATITNNRSSFSVTVNTNNATALQGAQTYDIAFGKVYGTALASIMVLVNDTSQDPAPAGSFEFTAQTSQYITLGGNISDWALDKTGTIEWWQKAPDSNAFAGNFNGGMITQGNQGGTGGLDIFAAGGNIAMQLGAAGVTPYVVEPASTTTWTHVAISFAPNPDNLNVGKSRVYFNGVEQSINNNSVLLSNSTDEIHIGSRVPDANYQNWTGKITNIHFSTAELYTSNFTPTIRTTPTTGTVFLMNSNSPTTDLSIYELNGVATSGNNGGTLYFAKSAYPNLNNQIRVGYNVVSVDPSISAVVTGAVFTADPNNWGVNVSPSMGGIGQFVNFSGTGRHTISGGIYTLSADVVNLHSALHSAANGGSSDVWIDTNPSNDAWAGSVPVGALIISQFSGRFTVTSVGRDISTGNWIIGAGTGGVGTFTAGETHTFIW